MNPIFAALAQGYDADQIVNYAIKAMPKIAPSVKRAKKQGYSPKRILDFISREMDQQTNDEIEASNVISGKRKKSHNKLVQGLLKEGVKLGTMAFGASLLARSAPQILGRLPGIGKFLGGTGEGLVAGEVAPGAAEVVAAEIPGAAESVGAQKAAKGIEQAKLTVAAEKEALKAAEAGLSETDQIARRYLDKKKLGNRLRTMKKAGKSREEMIEFLKKKMPVMEQEYIRSIGFTGEPGNLDERLGEMVDAYFPLGAKKGIEEAGAQLTEALESKQVKKPILGTDVITPEGELATVEEIPGKTAKLNIDGKKKIVKSSDLEPSPIKKEELADLYDDLIKGIESYTGKQVSRHVNLASYDANTNRLIYNPWLGDTYQYDELDPKDLEELLSVMNRKTSGNNFIGAWEEGTESPIGAAMNKLTRKLASERGRGKEYSAKYKSIYDALQPAREASYERYKKQKKLKRGKRK